MKWLIRKIQRRHEERIYFALTEQAMLRFDTHGALDARGAAFWDIAQALREERLITESDTQEGLRRWS